MMASLGQTRFCCSSVADYAALQVETMSALQVTRFCQGTRNGHVASCSVQPTLLQAENGEIGSMQHVSLTSIDKHVFLGCDQSIIELRSLPGLKRDWHSVKRCILSHQIGTPFFSYLSFAYPPFLQIGKTSAQGSGEGVLHCSTLHSKSAAGLLQ